MHPRSSTSCLRATLALFRGCVPSKERRFGALDLLPKEELEEAKTKLTEASKQGKYLCTELLHKSQCKKAQRLIFTPIYDTFCALGAQILHHLASSYHKGYRFTWVPINISNGEDFVDSRLGQKAK